MELKKLYVFHAALATIDSSEYFFYPLLEAPSLALWNIEVK